MSCCGVLLTNLPASLLQAWEQLTVHAQSAVDAGQAIHMQAAPSQAEALMHEFKAKKAAAAHKSKVCYLLAVQLCAIGRVRDSIREAARGLRSRAASLARKCCQVPG